MDGVRAMLMRGGTSKGVYLLEQDLPTEPQVRDDLLVRMLGSPDPRQVDGVGGGHPLASKVAVVAPGDPGDADVDYLFLQVSVDEPLVTDRQNCGNLLAGIGPFAVERGLVTVEGDTATVRIRMRNSNSIAVATFPVEPSTGMPRYEGTTAISGVPGTAAAIELAFEDIAGSTCGHLLPTGNLVDSFAGVDATAIDNGMPVVVLRADQLGLQGDESCEGLESNAPLRERLEQIRAEAGKAMGLGDVSGTTVPKLTIVSPPRAGGAITTRTFIPHRCHTSIGVLGAVSVATACQLPGTVADDLVVHPDDDHFTLEHPTGTFTATVSVDHGPSGVSVRRAGIVRTARKLMDGTVFPRATGPVDAKM